MNALVIGGGLAGLTARMSSLTGTRIRSVPPTASTPHRLFCARVRRINHVLRLARSYVIQPSNSVVTGSLP